MPEQKLQNVTVDASHQSEISPKQLHNTPHRITRSFLQGCMGNHSKNAVFFYITIEFQQVKGTSAD